MIWFFLGTLNLIIGLTNLAFIFVVLLSRKSPGRILSWLLVLFFLPFIGFLLFLFFGIDWRKQHIVKKLYVTSEWLPEASAKTEGAQYQDVPEVKKKRSVFTIAQSTTRLPVFLHNCVTPLSDTLQIMEVLRKDISEARHHIHMEFYIWQPDATGREMLSLLVDKANAGVEVRVIIDGLGSKKFFRKNIIRKIDPDKLLNIVCFRPVKMPFINLRANYRNHRKLVVIDGKITYLGGMNIGDEYIGKDPRFGYWRDTMLRLEGEATRSVQTIFFQDWHFMSNEKIAQNANYFPNDLQSNMPDTVVQVVSSSPHANWDTMAQLYFEMVASAESSLLITTPYVIPDDALMMALRTAALGGAEVKLLIPSKPDRWVSYLATSSYLEEMIISGIKVFGYDPERFIHSKVILVDGVLASIGSANLDQRSMNINFEVNAMIYDKGVVAQLTKDFEDDLLRSHEITLEMVRSKSLHIKVLEAGARLFSPIL